MGPQGKLHNKGGNFALRSLSGTGWQPYLPPGGAECRTHGSCFVVLSQSYVVWHVQSRSVSEGIVHRVESLIWVIRTRAGAICGWHVLYFRSYWCQLTTVPTTSARRSLITTTCALNHIMFYHVCLLHWITKEKFIIAYLFSLNVSIALIVFNCF